MKPERILLVDGQRLELVEENIAIALNAAGAGFITVKADHSVKGKSVELSVGYNGEVMKWFSGYVENDTPVGFKLFKCLVRESAEVLRYPLNISERHPTMRTIAAIIKDKLALTIILPDADYTDKKIPHFKHNGTGLQMLNMFGRNFEVPDYVWYCSVNGEIYAGSYAGCRFDSKPVELPVEFIKNDAGGNGWRIPVIASMRPGVNLNGHRVDRVQLINDDMLVRWSDNREPVIKTQLEAIYPEIGAKTHLPKFARVIAPTEAAKAGDIADPFRPKYAVDVQLLDENGRPAKDTPVYQGVPVPVPMAGAEAGMFQYPPPGTLVELGHVEGRQDKPVIRATHVEGQALPDIKPGEQLQQQRAEVFQRVHTDGSWQRETDQRINEKSNERHIEHDRETRMAGSRETTVTSDDTTTVLGTSKLMAGEIQNLADGDYSLAATKNMIAHADNCVFDVQHQIQAKCENWTTETQQNVSHQANRISEKISTIRESAAGILQKISAPSIQLACTSLQVTGASLSVGTSGNTNTATIHAGKIAMGDGQTSDCAVKGSQVWLGNEAINILQITLDLCDVVQSLASATASHTHPYVSTPTNAGAIASTGSRAASLKAKYSTVIKS